jgi:high-affinity Fe2+/Pb2+ permease
MLITVFLIFIIGMVFVGGTKHAFKAAGRKVEETAVGAAYVSWRDKVCQPVKFIRKEK